MDDKLRRICERRAVTRYKQDIDALCEYLATRFGHRPLTHPTSLLAVLAWRAKMVEEGGGMSELQESLRREGQEKPDRGEISLAGGLKIPAYISNRLFPYQLTGVRWMWEVRFEGISKGCKRRQCQEASKISAADTFLLPKLWHQPPSHVPTPITTTQQF